MHVFNYLQFEKKNLKKLKSSINTYYVAVASPVTMNQLLLGKTFQEILHSLIRIVAHISIAVQWSIFRDCSGGRISLREGREEMSGS